MPDTPSPKPTEAWKPADGAEKLDGSREAGAARIETAHFTTGNRSDEAPGRGVEGDFDLTRDRAYLDWRRTNGSARDSDYRRWRAETGLPFSEAFLKWAETGEAPSA